MIQFDEHIFQMGLSNHQLVVLFVFKEMFVDSLGQSWYLMQDDASMYKGCKPPRMPEACSFKESLAQMFEFRKLQKLWFPDEIRGIFSKVDSSLGVSVFHIRTDTQWFPWQSLGPMPHETWLDRCLCHATAKWRNKCVTEQGSRYYTP